MTDTKDRITEDAFAPAQSLLNLPLARPWRRALAMLCDLCVIAILTELEDIGLGLFLLTLWSIYKSGALNYLTQLGKAGVWLFRGLSLLVIAVSFWFVLSNVIQPAKESGENVDPSDVGIVEVFELGTSMYKLGQCQQIECMQSAVVDLLDVYVKLNSLPSASDLLEIVSEVSEDKDITVQQRQALEQWALGELEQRKGLIKPLGEVVIDNPMSEPVVAEEPTASSSTSPLQWILGFIADLGLGFGFAAIYFSCFTSWFNGQTFGKMLLNIRVIQLNDSEISLWESFGRYGGYGAGLATGLLGFLQIYWDPNRQGIQDKISATVVIDIGLSQREATDLIKQKA